MIKPTLLYGSLDIVSRETLEPLFSLSVGELRNPSQLERIRVAFEENNPHFIILASFKQVVNPSYSPLKDEQIKDL